MRTAVCALAFAAVAAAQDTDWKAAIDRGQSAMERGNYLDAIENYHHAEALAQGFRPHDTRVWTTENDLAMAYDDAGMPAESIRTYRREITLVEEATGKQNPIYAGALGNLAEVLVSVGECAAGEDLLRAALRIETGDSQAPPFEIAVTETRLSATLTTRRHSEKEAERLLNAAIPVLEASGDKFHVAAALNTRGVIRRNQHRYHEALDSFQKSLTILEGEFGASHPMLLNLLNNVAVTESLAGDYADAERVFTRALAICDARLPPGHPMRAGLLASYADNLQRSGEKSRAKAVRATAKTLAREAARRNGVGLTVDVAAFRR